MSGTQQLTINGALATQVGLSSIPSSGGFGAVTVPGTINYLLQAYLNTIDSTGDANVIGASGPSNVTGDPTNPFALFGQSSNVNYTVTNGVPSSIFGAGGNNDITLFSTSTPLNDSVYSAGNDTVNAFGGGSVAGTVVGGGNDFYDIGAANVTLTADGNATVAVDWQNANAGGSVDFINNSTVPATVYAGIFGTSGASTNVTAFGGAGGGFFFGGQKTGVLSNLLVGGAVGSVSVSGTGVITQVSADSTAGTVTLVGGGDGSILDAQGAAGQNALFAGSGNETLLAASSTGSNLFQLGLNYIGLGQPDSNGVVSTQGSGTQSYFIGNSNGATIYGSTASTAFNVYNFVSDATAGGGTFTILNFVPNTSAIFLIDGADTGPGSATISAIYQNPANSNEAVIGLSDGTTIKLVGVQAANLHSAVNTVSGTTFIYET